MKSFFSFFLLINYRLATLTMFSHMPMSVFPNSNSWMQSTWREKHKMKTRIASSRMRSHSRNILSLPVGNEIYVIKSNIWLECKRTASQNQVMNRVLKRKEAVAICLTPRQGIHLNSYISGPRLLSFLVQRRKPSLCQSRLWPAHWAHPQSTW